MTIVVVDYGAGNLTSVLRSLAAVGASPRVAQAAADLGTASAIVVPGVGHFSATSALDDRWRRAIREAADRDTPILGICLGMQWLFEGSAEAPGIDGLGIFAGRCQAMGGGVKVPHVGWNTLDAGASPSRLLGNAESTRWAYFTHAFAAPVGPYTSSTATHGETFAASVERGRVFGTQWHPEKSGPVGRRALATFVALAAGAR